MKHCDTCTCQRKPDPPASPETVRREADLARKKLIHVQQRQEQP